MPHLVNSLDYPLDAPVSVQSVLEQVIEAHRYLVQLGAQALANAHGTDATPDWGTQMKRAKIIFPKGERPTLITDAHAHHSLVEVINQCATMERLIDALTWANEQLPDYRLLRCHPTTGSQKVDEGVVPDNDIVLINADRHLAQFEVSDVSGTSDSNRKEAKDLTSLGVRLANMTDYPTDKNPYVNRLFMVVSAEFGERFRLNRTESYHERHQPYFRYQEHAVNGLTCVFEVLPR